MTADEVVIGRRRAGAPPPDMDLSPDATVSRPHARVWRDQAGVIRIADLGSRRGTRVKGRALGKDESCELPAGEPVLIGETTLVLEASPAGKAPMDLLNSGETIEGGASFKSPILDASNLEGRLTLLAQLPAKLAAETLADQCARVIVEHVAKLLPHTRQTALFLATGSEAQPLHLTASVPPDQTLLSDGFVRHAFSSKEAFVWSGSMPTDDSGPDDRSAVLLGMTSAIHAPVPWGKVALGVLSVNSNAADHCYTEADRLLLIMAAELAGAALGRLRAEEQCKQQADLNELFFGARFPLGVRKQILERAASSTLVFGTRESEVTIINADVRGFTQLNAIIGHKRMGDLLNEYFPALIEEILEQGGSIERTVGDAIFAVFGAPVLDNERHEDQHLRAVNAALQVQALVEQMNQRRRRRGAATCELGIGIDCGKVLHGFVGNADRMDFMVIGDAANYSQRYCAAAKAGEVVISPNVFGHVYRHFQTEPFKFEAKHEGALPAYRVLGRKATVGGATA